MPETYSLRQGNATLKLMPMRKRPLPEPCFEAPARVGAEGDVNGAPHPELSSYAKKFSGKYEHGPLPAASDTICRRKPRRLLPKPSSTSPKIRRHWHSQRCPLSLALIDPTFSTELFYESV